MAEYIEREKAIKETINSIVEVLNIHNSVPLIKITCKMREFPAADVVEVVRCKDCEYFFPQVGFNSCEKYSENHTHYIVTVDENDYCSKGERKDSND
jgi:hypothetical protein